MSSGEKRISDFLKIRLDKSAAHTLHILTLLILFSVIAHDCDHVRQAVNWGFTIPISLWVINCSVYILPVLSIFLVKIGRASAAAVTGITGIFTSCAFLVIHLFGSFSGNWGVWNYSYFELMKGVTYNGVFYQGVDWISWMFLFEVPAVQIPCAVEAFRIHRALKRQADEAV